MRLLEKMLKPSATLHLTYESIRERKLQKRANLETNPHNNLYGAVYQFQITTLIISSFKTLMDKSFSFSNFFKSFLTLLD